MKNQHREYQFLQDKKLNINTTHNIYTYQNADRVFYQATSYEILDAIINSGIITKDNHVIDYGSGKGRVAFYLNDKIGCKVTGIECITEIYNIAQNNLIQYHNPKDIEFINIEAIDYIPNGDICFFFHPFSASILEQVLNKIINESKCCKFLIFYWVLPSYEVVLNKYKELKQIHQIDCNLLTPRQASYNKVLIYTINK